MLNVKHQPLPKVELFWAHPGDAERAGASLPPPGSSFPGPSAGSKMLARNIPSTFATGWEFHEVSGSLKLYFEGRGLFPAGIWPLPGFLQGFVCVCVVKGCGLYSTTVILFTASNCWLNLVK